MTASATATAFLRRAAGLAAVLGIIAGILGMHVIAGSHSAHSAPAVSTVLPGVVSPADDADSAVHALGEKRIPDCAASRQHSLRCRPGRRAPSRDPARIFLPPRQSFAG